MVTIFLTVEELLNKCLLSEFQVRGRKQFQVFVCLFVSLISEERIEMGQK